jgi:hypothetical protein
MKDGVRTLVSLVCLALGFAGFWWLVPHSQTFGMFESETTQTALRVSLSFGATICGVVLGSLYRGLKILRDAGVQRIPKVSRFLSGSFRSVDMWLGLVAAPVVYALLLQSSSGMTLAGLVVTGLQNGFCCLVLANSLLGPNAPQPSPLPSHS